MSTATKKKGGASPRKQGAGNRKKKSGDHEFTESLGKIIITPPGEKPPKAMKVKADEIHDHYSTTVRWPLLVSEADAVFTIPKFQMCGTWWSLSLCCVGLDYGEGFLSVTLTNLSEEVVKAGYSITIKNQSDGDDYEWEDPEGILVFSKMSDGNNEWGADELISIDELESVEGLVANGKIEVQIDVYVHDRQDLNAHDNLAQQIESITDKKELIALANEDLVEVISKLPVRRNIKAQKNQEDKIVLVRGK